MKAHLYAVRIGARLQWRVSIDMKIDIHYWFGRYGANSGIVWLEPALSLGQAYACSRLLSSVSPQNVPPGKVPTLILQKWTNFLKAHAKSCHLNPVTVDAIRFEHIDADEWRLRGLFSSVTLNVETYQRLVQCLRGRELLAEEFHQLAQDGNLQFGAAGWTAYVQYAYLQDELELTNGLRVEDKRSKPFLWKKTRAYTCKRCGSGRERMFWSSCIDCGDECPYCEECLTMGRTRFCSILIRGQGVHAQARQSVQSSPASYQAYIEQWGLSEAQAAASAEGLRFVSGASKDSVDNASGSGARMKPPVPRSFLIWAVTGAGKTEMIFPFIQHELARGGKVLITTPRKDVVLELQPRITRAFSGKKVVTLYGGSEQRWEQGDIMIATTHQLLRFRQAFDLVIIDEIDAFPYHNNPMLEYAAQKVCKLEGCNILLSATPPASLRKAVAKGQMPHVKVPVRYHRHPLPVPVLLAVPSLQQAIKRKALPRQLFEAIRLSVDRGAQLFVFVPSIRMVDPLVEVLKSSFAPNPGAPALIVEGTSSKDPDRTAKVRQFRDGEIRLLVTTTILERGVTVPKTDVFILDAGSALFDESALVQMAGRAGRSKDDPAGKVYFAAKERTASQGEAIGQIKRMNSLARKRGYIKGERND